MRPAGSCGEVRKVIMDALRSHGSLTLREVAERTQVGYMAARRTIDNAMRSGAIVVDGYEKHAHCSRWIALYKVASPPLDKPSDRSIELEKALSTWR